MISEFELDELVATEVSPLWFKDSEQVKAFLLEEFCNHRTRLHIKTAAFWKYLIEKIIAADEPAQYTPPSRDVSFEAWVPLVMAAGGYWPLEQPPITKRIAAENFGLCKNVAKMHLHRIRRRSEIFFERGGQYIPAQRESKAEQVKIYNPLTYKLDRAVLQGHAQWKTPTYKLIQRSPELSSIITEEDGEHSDEGVRTFNEVNVLDEKIAYDYAALKGSVARLPCPSPIGRGGSWEYPDFDDEFWTFTSQYEGEHAYRGALQSCLAEMAGKRYAELCTVNKHNPSQLEGRAVLTDFGYSGSPEPASCGFSITLRKRGGDWVIEHSELGTGTVLKLAGKNGDIVCCKFNDGRANLTVATIKRKTGINLKTKFAIAIRNIAISEALARLTAQRKIVAAAVAEPQFFVPETLLINEQQQGNT
jgi:hypothetical protein